MTTLSIKGSAEITIRHVQDPHFWRFLEVALETCPDTDDGKLWIDDVELTQTGAPTD